VLALGPSCDFIRDSPLSNARTSTSSGGGGGGGGGAQYTWSFVGETGE
jgi:hypothetical protein